MKFWQQLSPTTQGTAALMLSHGLRLSLSLLMMIACARSLGPENFGLYSALISLAWIFQGLISFGIQTPLAQFLAKEPEQEKSWLGAAFVLHLGLALVGSLAYLILLFWQYGDSATAILGGMVLLPVLFFPLAENFNQALIAKQKIVLSALAGTMAFIGSSLLTLWAIHESSFKLCLLAFSLEFTLLGFILAWMHGRTRGLWPDPMQSWPQIAMLLRLAWPLFWAIGLQLLHQRISTILLERLSSAEEAGIFAATLRISSLIGTLMILLSTPFAAELARIYFHQQERFDSTLRRQLDCMAQIALLSSVLLGLAGPWLIEPLLGSQFQSAGELILPLGLAALLFCLRPLFDRVINLWAKPWQETLSYAVLLGSLVPLSFWLIPRYGALGAAWAMVASIVCGQYLFLLYFPQSRQFLRLQIRALAYPLRFALGKAEKPLSALRQSRQN